MQIIHAIEEMRQFSRKSHGHGRTIALVPTMGALHEGHFSLVRRAQTKCPVVAASIFVNPTQFGPGEDLEAYPRSLEQDFRALESLGVDAAFVPAVATIYPPGFSTQVDPGRMATMLEGAVRPGHFRGVATVVLKLFQIVQPDTACFGQKDFQQAAVIRRLVEDLNVDVQLEIVPTVREPDGLAKSSRNVYLNAEERRAATALPRALRHAQELWWAGERNPAAVIIAMEQALSNVPSLQADYVTIREPVNLNIPETLEPGSVALAATRVGTTRLIDNVIFGPREKSGEELVHLAFTVHGILR
ncbi:MAG TPA: pantoate--beta-alanine ligase [Terriglobia bacterium]|nr:pantoate--beta-alanine ligase [Terriglobia bacterium]